VANSSQSFPFERHLTMFLFKLEWFATKMLSAMSCTVPRGSCRPAVMKGFAELKGGLPRAELDRAWSGVWPTNSRSPLFKNTIPAPPVEEVLPAPRTGIALAEPNEPRGTFETGSRVSRCTILYTPAKG